MRALSILFLLLVASISYGKKTIKYPVTEISPTLLNKADAVVRYQETTIEIDEDYRFTEKVSFAITVLKESGAYKAKFRAFYNKLLSVNAIEATVFDAEGRKVKSIKNDDIKDISAISGMALYSDSRLKIIDPQSSSYPYTVEYMYQKKYKTLMYLPTLELYPYFDTSVEKSIFRVVTPNSYQLRYKERNFPVEVAKSQKEETNVYEWVVENQPSMPYEPYSAAQQYYMPMISLNPGKLNYEEFNGSFSTWADFGKLFNDINQGKETLPEETIQKVKALLTPEMSDYEKIQTIYQYSQQKNRYVLIVEGIGGLQPFSAATVDENSYGDCKALSNYTVALLKACGFNAYYVIIGAGAEQTFVDKEFAGNYFNHAIACVELLDQTVWLECTNSFFPAGYIGDFTDDRYAVVLKPEGGELIKTPAYKNKTNCQKTEANFQLTKSGDAICTSSLLFSGAKAGNILYLQSLDEEDRKKKIQRSIDCPNVRLKDYSIKSNDAKELEVAIGLDFETEKVGTVAGAKMYLDLNNLSKCTDTPPYSRKRKSPVQLYREDVEIDDFIYSLPEGMSVEALPKQVNIESEFGRYHFTVKEEQDTIHYHRELVIDKLFCPKEKYNDFVDFMEQIAQADKAKVILSIQ